MFCCKNYFKKSSLKLLRPVKVKSQLRSAADKDQKKTQTIILLVMFNLKPHFILLFYSINLI